MCLADIYSKVIEIKSLLDHTLEAFITFNFYVSFKHYRV